jgi:serine/threonine-protein kinase
MLYEMAVGTNPFGGDSPSATVARILDAKYDPPSDQGVDLAADLEAVISRCLEKSPDDRYADAGELLVDLAGVTPNAY